MLTNCSEVVNYLLKTYSTDDVIAETGVLRYYISISRTTRHQLNTKKHYGKSASLSRTLR